MFEGRGNLDGGKIKRKGECTPAGRQMTYRHPDMNWLHDKEWTADYA
jgi:hypothetical protein